VLTEYTRPPGKDKEKDKDAKDKPAGDAKGKGGDAPPPVKPPEKAVRPGG
jgi:hypothetical protein